MNVTDAQRRRLVRLCAAVTGDAAAAEDLAQETLLEAWRNAHKLVDPSGADRWLAAIARNVCRRHRRPDAAPPAEDVASFDDDHEIADAVERAMSELPPETRDVLVARYVLDLPHATIASRLGVSEDAVAMRLTRGKAMLRRLLDGDEWRETRTWCSTCGARRLVMRRDDRAIQFRCPSCHTGHGEIASALPLDNPSFARLAGDLVRPAALLTRLSGWSRGFYARGTDARAAACTRCGSPVNIRRFTRPDGPHRTGLYAPCTRCGEETPSSTAGLALAQPEVQRFRREHPKARALPEVTTAETLVVRYAHGAAGVDVVFARDTLRVLEVSGRPRPAAA